MNKTFGLGSLVVSALALTTLLGACDAGETEDASCSSNAQCAFGQVCNLGVCVASGSPIAGAGSGSTAGSGQGGAANTSAGAGSQAGSAGNFATGGTLGSAGSIGTAGATTQGGTNSAGASAGGTSAGGTSAGGTSAGGTSAGGTSAGGMSAGGMSGAGGAMIIPDMPSQCKDDFWPPTNNGSVTRYDFSQGTSLPACAHVITHTGAATDGDWDTVEGISTGDGGYFGAMNTTDYAQGATCGACVEATYNGRKVVLTIVDECPVSKNPLCVKGHIDLSRKAIRQLEPDSGKEHLTNVSWRYVKCPASGSLKARLHPNQNEHWKPLVIENGLFPLKSVTLNGVNATRTGNQSGGNAWIADGQKPPYTVRATDVNNGAVTFNYDDTGLRDVGKQFTCQ